MAGDTIITVVGNLTGDPELRFTPSGAPVANFTIASTPRSFVKETNEWKDGDTLFLRCSIWRDAAEHVAESLTKGMRVIATGRLTMRPYEKDGEKRTSTELQVDEVGPSLKYATAQVRKTERTSGGYGQQSSQQGQQPQGGDPWATNGSQGQQPQGATWGQQGPPPGGEVQRPGQQQGGWGNAPSYDEPPF